MTGLQITAAVALIAAGLAMAGLLATRRGRGRSQARVSRPPVLPFSFFAAMLIAAGISFVPNIPARWLPALLAALAAVGGVLAFILTAAAGSSRGGTKDTTRGESN